jgi:hypothetical protein
MDHKESFFSVPTKKRMPDDGDNKRIDSEINCEPWYSAKLENFLKKMDIIKVVNGDNLLGSEKFS